MKKLGIAVLAAASVVGATAQSANAASSDGPCATQRALFEKYDIELNMNAPLVGYAYNTACDVTG